MGHSLCDCPGLVREVQVEPAFLKREGLEAILNLLRLAESRRTISLLRPRTGARWLSEAGTMLLASTQTASIAADAKGPENLLGVMMLAAYSSERSLQTRQLAEEIIE